MATIKSRTTLAILAIFVSQTLLAPFVVADEWGAAQAQSPRFMLYASKSFGDRKSLRSAPKFGLRFERSARDFGLANLAIREDAGYRAIAELRWTQGFGQSVMLAGSPVYATADYWDARANYDTASSGGKLQSKVIRAAYIAFFVAAGLCALETLICEDDDDYSAETDTGSPGLDN